MFGGIRLQLIGFLFLVTQSSTLSSSVKAATLKPRSALPFPECRGGVGEEQDCLFIAAKDAGGLCPGPSWPENRAGHFPCPPNRLWLRKVSEHSCTIVCSQTLQSTNVTFSLHLTLSSQQSGLGLTNQVGEVNERDDSLPSGAAPLVVLDGHQAVKGSADELNEGTLGKIDAAGKGWTTEVRTGSPEHRPSSLLPIVARCLENMLRSAYELANGDVYSRPPLVGLMEGSGVLVVDLEYGMSDESDATNPMSPAMVALTYIASHVSLVVSEASVPCASVLSLFLSVLPGPLYTFACSPSGDSAHMKHEPSLCCHQPYQAKSAASSPTFDASSATSVPSSATSVASSATSVVSSAASKAILATSEAHASSATSGASSAEADSSSSGQASTDVQLEAITTDVQPEAITTDVQPEAITTDVQPEVITTDVQLEAITTDVQPEAVTTDVQPEAVTTDVQPEAITSDISIHRTFDLSHRAGDVPDSTADLAPHLGDLSHRTGDLAPHPSDLSHHTGDLAPHPPDLSHRTGDVPDSTADLAPHLGNPSHRAGDLADHTADLATRALDLLGRELMDETADTSSEGGAATSSDSNVTSSNGEDGDTGELVFTASVWGLVRERDQTSLMPIPPAGVTLSLAGFELHSTYSSDNIDYNKDLPEIAEAVGLPVDKLTLKGGPLESSSHVYAAAQPRGRLLSSRDEVWNYDTSGGGGGAAPSSRTLSDVIMCPGGPLSQNVYWVTLHFQLSTVITYPEEVQAKLKAWLRLRDPCAGLGSNPGPTVHGFVTKVKCLAAPNATTLYSCERFSSSAAVRGLSLAMCKPVEAAAGTDTVNERSSSSGNLGLILGCVLGGLAFVAITASIAVWAWRRSCYTPVPSDLSSPEEGNVQHCDLWHMDSHISLSAPPAATGVTPVPSVPRKPSWKIRIKGISKGISKTTRLPVSQSANSCTQVKDAPSGFLPIIPASRVGATSSVMSDEESSLRSTLMQSSMLSQGLRITPSSLFDPSERRSSTYSPSASMRTSRASNRSRNSRFSQASMRSSLRSSVRSSRGSRNQPLPYTAMEAAMREGSRQARGKIDDDLAEATEGSAVSTASPALSRDKLVLSATSVQMARACSSGSPAGSPVLGDRSSPLLGSVDSPLRQPGSSRSASSAVPPALLSNTTSASLSVSECSDGGGSFTHSILSRDMSQMSVASKNNSFIPIFSHPSCMSQNELNPQEGIRGPGDALLHQHVVLSQGGTPMAGGSRGAGLSSLANVGLPTSHGCQLSMTVDTSLPSNQDWDWRYENDVYNESSDNEVGN